MIQVLTFETIGPSQNQISSAGVSKKLRRIKAWKDLAVVEIARQGFERVDGPFITCIMSRTPHRNRGWYDPENLAAMSKLTTDVLVSRGLLPGDTPDLHLHAGLGPVQHVIGYSPRVVYGLMGSCDLGDVGPLLREVRNVLMEEMIMEATP